MVHERGRQTPILRTENLVKQFGDLTAVDGVTVSFQRDQICGLIGPNGAGKTTLVNLLTGGLDATSGEIYFDGNDITDATTHEITRADLGRTFQISNTFETLSTYDNIRLSLRADMNPYNLWKDFDADEEINEEAERIIDRFGLSEFADKPPTVLSHGDTRKIELAIAVANDPKMLLLDEPSSGMSGGELTALTALLKDVGSDIPLLVIEHNIEIIRDICDRLIVLNDGQLLADGAPSEVRDDAEVRKVYFGETL